MRIFSIVFVLFFSLNTLARYEVYNNEQIVESEDARKARKEAIEKATEAVVKQKISAMIGEKRTVESAKIIEKQVLPQKNKFIPFFKVAKYDKVKDGFKFQVEVKLSAKDLRQVLRQVGLFSSSHSTGLVFPFVEFNDHTNGESFRWWMAQFDTKLGLQQMARDFENQMAPGFISQGLMFIKPQTFSLRGFIPEYLQKSFLTQTEKVQIASIKNSQLYMEGKVDVVASPLREDAYRIRMQLRCFQVSNGRNVADIVRSIDTPSNQSPVDLQKVVANLAKESGADLANQINDLWQRGALEAQTIKLAVTGELNHMQMVAFKKILSQSVTGIQNLREHLFEPGRVTFEVDYSGGSIDKLQSSLKKVKLEGFLSQVVAASASEVILDVKAVNTSTN